MNCPQCFCGPAEPKGYPLWFCGRCGLQWEETPAEPAAKPALAAEPAAKPAAEPIDNQVYWAFYSTYGYYPKW